MIDRVCVILKRLSETLIGRVKKAGLTIPDQASCCLTIVWIALFACFYLPIALKLGFLKPTWPSSWVVVVSVIAGAFVQPPMSAVAPYGYLRSPIG